MKLIFLDIDGTLVLPGSMEPTPAVKEALAKARAAGHKVFLSTGRNHRMIEPLLSLGFDGAVCAAGGTVYIGSEKIYGCPIPTALLQEARRLFEDSGMGFILECEQASFGGDSFGAVIAEADAGSSELARWQEAMRSNMGVRNTADYDGSDVYKMCFACKDRATLEAIRPKLEESFKICLFDFRPLITNGEIIYRAFDKGTALKQICEYYGADVRDTIAFGDSANDIQMLQAAGIGYCMENGMPEAKAAADRICPSVKEDGVAVAFEELGLI